MRPPPDPINLVRSRYLPSKAFGDSVGLTFESEARGRSSCPPGALPKSPLRPHAQGSVHSAVQNRRKQARDIMASFAVVRNTNMSLISAIPNLVCPVNAPIELLLHFQGSHEIARLNGGS